MSGVVCDSSESKKEQIGEWTFIAVRRNTRAWAAAWVTFGPGSEFDVTGPAHHPDIYVISPELYLLPSRTFGAMLGPFVVSEREGE